MNSDAIVAVVSNGTTALAYYWITYQLLSFAANSKVKPRISVIHHL